LLVTAGRVVGCRWLMLLLWLVAVISHCCLLLVTDGRVVGCRWLMLLLWLVADTTQGLLSLMVGISSAYISNIN